jgi:hypothetical protein
MFKMVSPSIPTMNILYFDQFKVLLNCYSPLRLPSHPYDSTTFSTHHYVLCYTDEMHFDIVDSLPFTFNFIASCYGLNGADPSKMHVVT